MKIVNKTKRKLKLYMWDNPTFAEPFAALELGVDKVEEIPEITYMMKIEEVEE